jgi:flagellar protein FliS
MKPNIELSYRRSAIEGASPIGLVIALYDTLSGDLRRAARAIRNDDIETRCTQLNHAVLVIGQLEDWIDTTNGGELAHNLTRFYSHLRNNLFRASLTKSATLLESQIELIVQLRSAWQQRDTTFNVPSTKTTSIQLTT